MNERLIVKLNEETSIVFGGVVWKPLVGSNPAAQSTKEAVAQKATHYVAGDDHTSIVGTITLPIEKGRKKKHHYFSAAAIFARSHPTGVIYFQRELPEGEYWVVATQDGVVIRDTDVIVDLAEANDLQKAIKARYANAVVVNDQNDPLQYLNSHTELTLLKGPIARLPKPLKVGVCALLALMALDTAYDQYKKYERKRDMALESTQAVDAVFEWKGALNKWAASQRVDGSEGLAGLYEGVKKIPMKIGGWNLAEAVCLPGKDMWNCTAQYQAGISATNISFSDGLPDGWTAKWIGLTGAAGSWQFPAKRMPINRAEMIVTSDFNLRYISALQSVLPAYQKVDLAAAKLVPITDPKVIVNTRNGEQVITVPYPAGNHKGIERPLLLQYTLTGPLRSYTVLPISHDTMIKSFKISVQSANTKPNLRSSKLIAEFVGEIYVR